MESILLAGGYEGWAGKRSRMGFKKRDVEGAQAVLPYATITPEIKNERILPVVHWSKLSKTTAISLISVCCFSTHERRSQTALYKSYKSYKISRTHSTAPTMLSHTKPPSSTQKRPGMKYYHSIKKSLFGPLSRPWSRRLWWKFIRHFSPNGMNAPVP